MLAGCLQNFLTKDGRNVASTGCFRSWYCGPRRQPAKTASHRHLDLVKSVSGRHRRRNRPVASATTSVYEGKLGTSFRVPAVANRLFSEPPPISNRLFSEPPKAFTRRHSAFAYIHVGLLIKLNN